MKIKENMINIWNAADDNGNVKGREMFSANKDIINY